MNSGPDITSLLITFLEIFKLISFKYYHSTKEFIILPSMFNLQLKSKMNNS